MSRWRFTENVFNWNGEVTQIGSIIDPEGCYFAAVEGDYTDARTNLDNVLRVLNRELPDGKPRKRKAKVKHGG